MPDSSIDQVQGRLLPDGCRIGKRAFVAYGIDRGLLAPVGGDDGESALLFEVHDIERRIDRLRGLNGGLCSVTYHGTDGDRLRAGRGREGFACRERFGCRVFGGDSERFDRRVGRKGGFRDFGRIGLGALCQQANADNEQEIIEMLHTLLF